MEGMESCSKCGAPRDFDRSRLLFVCHHCGAEELAPEGQRLFRLEAQTGLACPVCGGPVHKLMSSPAFQFKGTGWYITDYAKKSGVGSDTKAPSSSDGSSAKDSSKESSKESSSKESKESSKESKESKSSAPAAG